MLTPETLAAWRKDAETYHMGPGIVGRDRRILALLDALAKSVAALDRVRALADEPDCVLEVDQETGNGEPWVEHVAIVRADRLRNALDGA